MPKRDQLSRREALNSLLLVSGAVQICAAAPMFAAARAAGYPDRPVRWIVPYTPGGATDVLSRLVCDRLTQRLGQPFIVENKPGAGSTVGTQLVISAPPDGHTLLLISTANAINASFDPRIPFNFERSIVPVAGVARIPLVLSVNKDLPIRSIREFIDFARDRSHRVSIGSSGIGTSLHLSGELFKSMAGIDFAHVPYGGSAPGLAAVISGEIQGMFDNVTSSAPFIQSGQLRALGVTTLQRSDILPDVPPIADTLPGFETSSFYGLGAPRGTPKPIVDLLNREILLALQESSVAKQIHDLGALPIEGDAETFAQTLATETKRWAAIVQKANVHAE